MKLYRSGLVQRYHSNPDLARFGQTNAAHQWGVAALILKLHPMPSRDLIVAALLHDVGEIDTGDLASPFKRKYPEIADCHSAIEYQHRDETIGPLLIPCFMQLDDTESDWLRMCDSLEAFLFAKNHRPDILDRDGWPEQVLQVRETARRLNVYAEIARLTFA
jgi:5'-deoxynucleotidase YfbR-like HD superfamily hydrolase